MGTPTRFRRQPTGRASNPDSSRAAGRPPFCWQGFEHQGARRLLALPYKKKGNGRSRSPMTADQRIGGAYCRPPFDQSALTPRAILRREPAPTVRSKLSP